MRVVRDHEETVVDVGSRILGSIMSENCCATPRPCSQSHYRVCANVHVSGDHQAVNERSDLLNTRQRRWRTGAGRRKAEEPRLILMVGQHDQPWGTMTLEPVTKKDGWVV